MGNRNLFTKILAIAGTALVWFPVLAPLLFSLLRLMRSGSFMLDYLMPAEMFPVALVGGGLLLWAALRARSQQVLIGAGLAAAVALLVGGQALAIVTGLASGEAEPVGLPWVVVVAALVLYGAALIAVGVGGVRLSYAVFKTRPQPAAA